MPLQIGKTPIVVPRQHQFNEHVNDHQVEFARNVAQRMGTIIPVEDINTLGDIITNYDQIVAGIRAVRTSKSLSKHPSKIRNNPSSKPVHQYTDQATIPPLITHPEERIWAEQTPPAAAPGPGRSEDQAQSDETILHG